MINNLQYQNALPNEVLKRHILLPNFPCRTSLERQRLSVMRAISKERMRNRQNRHCPKTFRKCPVIRMKKYCFYFLTSEFKNLSTKTFFE